MKIQTLFEDSLTSKIVKKYNITKRGPQSTGLDENKGIWYGWSHRAICGFKIGDKIFEPNYGDDNTPFVKHGPKPIKTLDDAKQAAINFSKYIS